MTTKKKRKRSSITLSMTEEEKIALEKIAAEFDCLWGNEPNVSELLRRIANGSLRVHEASLPVEIADVKSFKENLAIIQSATLDLLRATTLRDR